jgi:hypothetical protein
LLASTNAFIIYWTLVHIETLMIALIGWLRNWLIHGFEQACLRAQQTNNTVTVIEPNQTLENQVHGVSNNTTAT